MEDKILMCKARWLTMQWCHPELGSKRRTCWIEESPPPAPEGHLVIQN